MNLATTQRSNSLTNLTEFERCWEWGWSWTPAIEEASEGLSRPLPLIPSLSTYCMQGPAHVGVNHTGPLTRGTVSAQPCLARPLGTASVPRNGSWS